MVPKIKNNNIPVKIAKIPEEETISKIIPITLMITLGIRLSTFSKNPKKIVDFFLTKILLLDNLYLLFLMKPHQTLL